MAKRWVGRGLNTRIASFTLAPCNSLMDEEIETTFERNDYIVNEGYFIDFA
jgi:hypothetical protein